MAIRAPDGANKGTCEHMILGQLRMRARQTKNAPLLYALIVCPVPFIAILDSILSCLFVVISNYLVMGRWEN